ncbi:MULTISPECIES: hypothetical protein [Nostoc]|uniref:Uncharacterized protein n=1 Tax=Nostoc paludosum FACHB-159 TaxID=2692908 RepID=A0ABR8KF76_9NOSO|nr:MULTISPECIES: hypothetical protein [Nostoc]MBD2680558.1 hypothetical protein [Nostoc sp. FACHB-857]MBD2736950.1 hypothetical protein [Nostoc paludosum FACHB-159]
MSFTGKGLKCELNAFGLLYQCRSSLSIITHFDRTNRTDGVTARRRRSRTSCTSFVEEGGAALSTLRNNQLYSL